MFLLLILLTGCNLTGFIDQPSNNDQYLSKAQACIDAGNLACATHYYGIASTTDNIIMGRIYTALATVGITEYAFLEATMNHGNSIGSLITNLANTIGSKGTATTRLNLVKTYSQYTKISNQTREGFARFIMALGILSNLLAEISSSPGNLKQSDLVTNPSLCLTALNALNAININSYCAGPSHSNLIVGTSITSISTSEFQGVPTLFMINTAITELEIALSIIGSFGSLGSQSTSFVNILSTAASSITTDDATYRGALIKNGIGI